MSAPPTSPKSLKTAAPADGDHRKRRRNRTTQSCLNCHATKRMCDRKRPCTRCSQLGIAANCVYEVDDPNRQGQGQGQGDERSRLMNRVAELEGVIRELRNKSHAEMSPTSSHTPLPAGGPNNVGWPAFPSSPGPSGSSSRFPSAPGYPRQSDSLASLISAYAGLTDHMFVRRGGNCGCLNDVACYNVVLELSLRLRKAADVLARSPSHSNPCDCTLNTHISDLDMFAKNMLLDRDIPNYSSLSMPPGGGLNRGHSGFGYAPASSSPSTDENSHGWNGPGGESEGFMSWAPQRKNL